MTKYTALRQDGEERTERDDNSLRGPVTVNRGITVTYN